MSIPYEARYWMRVEGKPLYLGCEGGSTSAETWSTLLDTLGCKMKQYVMINSQFEVEDNSSIIIFCSNEGKKENEIKIINYWLANSPPEVTTKYLGKNPENVNRVMKFEADCWNLYGPLDIAGAGLLLVTMINTLKNSKMMRKFPDNHLLGFNAFSDDDDTAPYVYGYFKSLDQVDISKDILSKVNSDEYTLAFSIWWRTYVFSISKDKYNSEDIIEGKDIKIL